MRTAEKQKEVDDIYESDLVRTGKCFNCGTKERTLVRMTITEDGNEAPTLNEIDVCTSKNCFRYTDISRTPTWKPKEIVRHKS